jgi:hypothetical protein
LPLVDIQQLCLVSKYLNHVCHSERLTSKYNTVIKNISDTLNKCCKTYSLAHINVFIRFINKLDIQEIKIFKEISHDDLVNIQIIVYTGSNHYYDYVDGYYIEFLYMKQQCLYGVKRYFGEKKSIMEFLIHVYYNDLVYIEKNNKV